MKRSRVVVTGLGAVSPLGLTAAALWRGLVEGRSGLGFATSFDVTHFPVKVTGEVAALPAAPAASRTHQLLARAAREAAAHAGLATLPASTRWGTFCARSFDWPDARALVRARRAGTAPTVPPGRTAAGAFASYRFGAAAPKLAAVLGVPGAPRVTRVIDAACASGGMAVGEAFRQVRDGVLEVGVAAGASSWTNLLGLLAYSKLTALSPEARVPSQASRPFDARRSGFVMAEGAGVVVLERLEHALARGAAPLAEVTGYGASVSAFRITDLPPEGAPQSLAMQLALRDAGRSSGEVDYVNAHGTSTYQNDLVETRALRRLLGKRCYEVPVSSNKSMIGHTITAAGALEAIATVCTVRAGLLPPTINLTEPDPECDLDYVPLVARRHPVRVALSNSFGFGGQNCALVVEAWTP
jgi:3-oxoacyl-[acyl-carrier-protein] synthase II